VFLFVIGNCRKGPGPGGGETAGGGGGENLLQTKTSMTELLHTTKVLLCSY